MPWPSFLTRNRGRPPRPLPEIPAGYDMYVGLKRRRDERDASRSAAALKGHATRRAKRNKAAITGPAARA